MVKKLILASQSPRRKQLLSDMGFDFETITLDINESYPSDLQEAEITQYLCKKKAEAYGEVPPNSILITADTIVWQENKAVEKPKDEQDAFRMLKELSGKSHQVFTSVGISHTDSFEVISDKTEVLFQEISDEDAQLYIQNFSPLDKAGSYGIQDWIGLTHIRSIVGNYYTVMGLPTDLVYERLKKWA